MIDNVPVGIPNRYLGFSGSKPLNKYIKMFETIIYTGAFPRTYYDSTTSNPFNPIHRKINNKREKCQTDCKLLDTDVICRCPCLCENDI